MLGIALVDWKHPAAPAGRRPATAQSCSSVCRGCSAGTTRLRHGAGRSDFVMRPLHRPPRRRPRGCERGIGKIGNSRPCNRDPVCTHNRIHTLGWLDGTGSGGLCAHRESAPQRGAIEPWRCRIHCIGCTMSAKTLSWAEAPMAWWCGGNIVPLEHGMP